MIKIICAVCLCCLATGVARAQFATLKGRIISEQEKKGLENAIVALLNSKDSTFCIFQRTDKSGAFDLQQVKMGKYILLVAYPGSIDYMDTLSINSTLTRDMGAIALYQGSMLEEVIVNGRVAMRFKGDTLEFDAESFKVKEGGTVEDLLKKLPGIRVDSRGKISAFGKTVDRVLVDGEEFFGDDPSIATKNLLARSVDKVQVYDTKSDIEKLTGVTKSDANKTVDIKLKEEAKKGSFGKAEAGAGTENIVNAKAMYNRFRPKQKMSFFGSKSNTSIGALSSNEREQLGMPEDREYDAISGNYLSLNAYENEARYSNTGLPNAYTAGGLFSNKWDSDTKNVYASYKYNRLGINGGVSTYTQTQTEGKSLFEESITKENVITELHRGALRYESKIDSLHTLKFVAAFAGSEVEGTTGSTGKGWDDNNTRINEVDRSNATHSTTRRWENQLLITRRSPKKKGRSISTLLHLGFSNDNSSGQLNTLFQYYKNDSVVNSSGVSQLKQYNGSAVNTGIKLVWVEPIGKKFSVVTDYSFNNSNANAKKDAYDPDNNGKYTILNDQFSNDFGLRSFSNTANMMLRYKWKKWNAQVGNGLSFLELRLQNRDSGRRDMYNYVNVVPQANIGYNFTTQKKMNIYYSGTTVQPSLLQLQPIQDNTDPLNIYRGNPRLDVGFNHTLGLNFSNYEVTKGKVYRINTGITYKRNDISTLSILNVNTGQRVFTPVNINGNNNWFFWGMHSWGDNPRNKFKFQINMNASGGRNVTILNDNRYTTEYTMIGSAFYTRYELSDIFEASVGLGVQRFLTKSNIEQVLSNNYWNFSTYSNVNVTLPWKMQLTTELNGDVFQRMAAVGRSNNMFIWEASLSKRLLRNNPLRVSIDAHDILNQNVGFSRNINSNIITESRVIRLGRYFMINLLYTFNSQRGIKK